MMEWPDYTSSPRLVYIGESVGCSPQLLTGLCGYTTIRLAGTPVTIRTGCNRELEEGAGMSAKPTHEELLRDITERARALWGEAKASEMASALEQTALQMEEIDRTMPKRDVEPGFYQ